MIASLPMYDLPSTRSANDRFWTEIRRVLGRGPEQLLRNGDLMDQWTSADLLLSQTCGLPFRVFLHDRVKLVGTPDYGVADCSPGHYRSHLVVRDHDPRDTFTQFQNAVVARNDAMSQSGWVAFEAEWQSVDVAFTGRILDSGSHRASIKAVAHADADIAAIDAVTWAILARDTADTNGLRILRSTQPTPGLPLITSLIEDANSLLAAVTEATEAISPEDREQLMLKGIAVISAAEYLSDHKQLPAHTP